MAQGTTHNMKYVQQMRKDLNGKGNEKKKGKFGADNKSRVREPRSWKGLNTKDTSLPYMQYYVFNRNAQLFKAFYVSMRK